MLPIGHALAMAMTIGHDASIPGDITLISEPTAQQLKHLSQGKAKQSQDSTYGKDDIQQEVLVRRYLIHSWPQVAGAVVSEDVVDPVHSPGHRVA